MAESIFDNDNVQSSNSSNIFDTPSNDTKESNVQNDVVGVSEDNVYSEEELNDPNAINVSITDSTAPLIVLFGPPSCGKTMTLVRLTRFLSRKGYIVAPIRNFRPTYDTNYAALCDGFDTLINSDDAADSTNKINFMLVEVMKNGKRICQMLEAPGELYFNKNKPQQPFPNFLNTIMSRNNRKIWAVMVEPNWLEASDRKNYVNKIMRLKQKMRAKDKSIIVFNKIDMTNYVRTTGNIHISGAVKEIRDLYPGLIESYKNLNPITSLWKKYDVNFVPFQTGDYSVTASGRKSFQEGPDEYPKALWEKILKGING